MIYLMYDLFKIYQYNIAAALIRVTADAYNTSAPATTGTHGSVFVYCSK